MNYNMGIRLMFVILDCLFRRKFYILKDVRKGQIDAKSVEGIFLGYSNRSKAQFFLNLTTQNVKWSSHVKIDEFVERREEKSIKELEDYIKFVYY